MEAPPPSRRLAWVSLAIVIVVVAATVAYVIAPHYLDGLSGSSLIVERVESVERPLGLNETETAAQAPALAQLLDEAFEEGRATVSGRENYRPMLTYLDGEAKEAGGSAFFAAPFHGTVEWRGAHFEVLRLMDG